MNKTRILRLAALFAALLTLAACGYRKGDQTAVMTIDGKKVTGELYDYVYQKNVEVRFGIGTEEASLTDGERALVRDDAIAELRKFYAVESLAAKEGVALNEVEIERVKGEMKSSKAGYQNKKEYYAAFKEQHMTENVFYIVALNYYLEEDLAGHLREKILPSLDDARVKSDVENYFYTAMQIYLPGDDAEERMTSIKSEIDGGASFEETAEKYSRDGKRIRCFTEGEMQAFFEDAVKALQPGEISGVIVSDFGAHLILRLENDPAYVDAHLDDLRESDFARIYNAMLLEEANALEVEIVKLPE